jgi:hypothetical protein
MRCWGRSGIGSLRGEFLSCRISSHFLWLFLCIVGSIVIVGMTGGGHGSVIFIIAGAFTGLCGAAAHVFLLIATSLRAYTKLKQVLVVSAVAMFTCLVAGVVFYFYNKSGGEEQKVFETALFLFFYPLVVIAPVSFIVCSSMTVTERIIDVETQRRVERLK